MAAVDPCATSCCSQTSISKLQCLIAKTDGLLFIRDLGSTNGTKVNGQRVTRGALLPGDELAFASLKFRVHLGPSVPGEESVIGADERTEVLDGIGEAPSEEYEVGGRRPRLKATATCGFSPTTRPPRNSFLSRGCVKKPARRAFARSALRDALRLHAVAGRKIGPPVLDSGHKLDPNLPA